MNFPPPIKIAEIETSEYIPEYSLFSLSNMANIGKMLRFLEEQKKEIKKKETDITKIKNIVLFKY